MIDGIDYFKVDGEEIDVSDAEKYGCVTFWKFPDGSMVVNGNKEFTELLTVGKDPKQRWVMPNIWFMPGDESEGYRVYPCKSPDGSVFLYPREEDRLDYTAGAVSLGKVIDCSTSGGNAVCLQVGWGGLPYWTGDGWRQPEADPVYPGFQCGSLLLTFPWTAVVRRAVERDSAGDPYTEWSKDALRQRRAPVLAAAPRDLGVAGDVDLLSGNLTFHSISIPTNSSKLTVRYEALDAYHSTARRTADGLITVDEYSTSFDDLASADSDSVLKIYMGDDVMDVIDSYEAFLEKYAGVSKAGLQHMHHVTTAKLQ